MGAWAAAASIAATVISSAIQAHGQQQQAKQEAAVANYQAEVANNNALIARQNADQAIAVGNAQAEQAGLRNSAQMGAIQADAAANGVDINSGSNALVRKSQRQIGQTDVLSIRSNAAQNAYNYEAQANTQQAQAGLYQQQAAYAPIAGDIGAMGTLFSGLSSVGSKYSMWQMNSGGGGK